jgi:hypothetical protein
VSPPRIVEEATPRKEEDVAKLAYRPLVVESARERGVTEVVHFTTITNMIGILHTSLMCWSLVRENPDVDKVYDQNCPSRYRDADWVDYVNLSVSRINHWMFSSSSGRWHPDAVWVILVYDVEILGHPGVVFTTTNNAYPECLRAERLAGFKRLFDDPVVGHGGRLWTRARLPEHFTTDHCAEVLYPFSVSNEHLRRIYARCDEDTEQLAGILGGLDVSIGVTVDSGRFHG